MKHALVVFAILASGIFLLFQAHKKGQKRYIYEIDTYNKFVPLPNIYDIYTAYGTDAGENKIRVTWNHIGAPKGTVSYFTVVGKLKTEIAPYYVLSMDEKLYVEKAEHVEPLIKALCALSRGGPPENHPAEIAEVIQCLPDDRDTLINLAGRFKAPKVYR